MSWQTINHILGWAAIDPTFRQRLQQDPLAVLESQGMTLTAEELDVFKKFASCPFPEFCQHLLEELGPEKKYTSGW